MIKGWKKISTPYGEKHFKEITYQNRSPKRKILFNEAIKTGKFDELESLYPGSSKNAKVPIIKISQDRETKRGGWYVFLEVPWTDFEVEIASEEKNKKIALAQAKYFMKHFPDISVKTYDYLRDYQKSRKFYHEMWKETR